MKLLLFILFLCPIFSFAQNKLGNPSFEYREDATYCNHDFMPNNIAFAGCLDEWEDRNGQDNGPAPNEDPNEENQSNIFNPHSPDWYSFRWYVNDNGVNVRHQPLQEKITTQNFVDVLPHSGTDFIGMGPCELTQQHLANCNNIWGEPDECLEVGEEYTVAMYIRTLGDPISPDLLSQGVDYSDVYLNVYLATDPIRYKHNNDDSFCENNYCEHKTGFDDWGQDIQLVANFKIDWTLYPRGEWHFIWSSFIAPDDTYGAAHNWFAIEVVQNNLNGACKAYIGIDDVSLMKCKPSCSRTAGEMWALPVNNPHTENNPFGLTNLYNVSNIKFQIWNYMAQTLVKEYNFSSVNGFQETVFWNGKNESGAEVAAGLYEAEITLTNDCGTKKQKFKFDKINGIFTSTIPVNNAFDDPQIPIPINCCALEPDYYIDNITLPGTAYVDYIATHGVYAATEQNSIVTVANNADVLFQAGTEVVMGPGFTVEYGADFIAQILPCQISGKTDETAINGYNGNINNDDIIIPEEPRSQDIEIRIIPNPNNGMFMVQTNNTETKSITVQNLIGNTVYQSNNTMTNNIEIDLRNYSVGVYIVQVNYADGKTNTGKVIIE